MKADLTAEIRRKGEGLFSKQVSFQPLPVTEAQEGQRTTGAGGGKGQEYLHRLSEAGCLSITSQI